MDNCNNKVVKSKYHRTVQYKFHLKPFTYDPLDWLIIRPHRFGLYFFPCRVSSARVALTGTICQHQLRTSKTTDNWTRKGRDLYEGKDKACSEFCLRSQQDLTIYAIKGSWIRFCLSVALETTTINFLASRPFPLPIIISETL